MAFHFAMLRTSLFLREVSEIHFLLSQVVVVVICTIECQDNRSVLRLRKFPRVLIKESLCHSAVSKMAKENVSF